MSGDLDAQRDRAGDGDDAVERAAAVRRRLRLAREEGERSASFRDVLVAAAERGVAVVLTTRSGRVHRAVPWAVGLDAVAAGTGDRTLLLGLDAVRSVSAAGDSAARASGDGWGAGAVQGIRMRDILADALGHRPRISCWVGDVTLSGVLVALGVDVLTMREDGLGNLAYVRLDSTTELSFSLSSST